MKNILAFPYDKSLISPSLLAADFCDLANDVTHIEKAGADLLHLDIMDGHMVPNISFGPGIVKALRGKSELLFDTHLMISHPAFYAPEFAKAGSDHITFHLECDDPADEVISVIRKTGCSVGISLKPGTPAEAIFPYLDKIDMVLVMTVEPGFGGQKFMADQVGKIRLIRQECLRRNLAMHIEVDGGIDAETAPLCREAGANVFVAGTSVFRNPAGAEYAIRVLK